MAEEKDKSPNKDIDKALKNLMKAIAPKKGEEAEALAPEEIKAHVAVVAAAMKWEQIKNNLKDTEGFDPNNI